MSDQGPQRYVFPRWTNYLLPAMALLPLGGMAYMITLAAFGANATTLNVGYQPKQVLPYSHEMHVNQLGMDCRYCHTTAETADFAAIPPTQVCLNCHHPSGDVAGVYKDSPKLAIMRDSFTTGMPIEWIKVHDLADYVYFSHSAHVSRGIGCVSCHGRVDKMGEEGVYQVNNLSMGWCLSCHRQPELHLRPVEAVTNMTWQPPGGDQMKIGTELKDRYNIRDQQYMTACSTCHR